MIGNTSIISALFVILLVTYYLDKINTSTKLGLIVYIITKSIALLTFLVFSVYLAREYFGLRMYIALGLLLIYIIYKFIKIVVKKS